MCVYIIIYRETVNHFLAAVLLQEKKSVVVSVCPALDFRGNLLLQPFEGDDPQFNKLCSKAISFLSQI